MRNKFKKSHIVFVLLLSMSIFYSSLFYTPKNLNLNKSNPNYSHNSPVRPNLAINLDWNKTLINTGEDSGRDIVIDVDGNIYLAGKEYNTSRGVFDIVIAKYLDSNNLKELQEKIKSLGITPNGIGFTSLLYYKNNYLNYSESLNQSTEEGLEFGNLVLQLITI